MCPNIEVHVMERKYGYCSLKLFSNLHEGGEEEAIISTQSGFHK